ncbi:MAG: threonine/serine exporter family protein [Clostridia bacterium]|nr:threonine/serine exporter family protein [Clostridia bacterium]
MQSVPEEIIRALLGAFFGTLGFAWLVHAPRRAWIPSGMVASLVYLLYRVLTVLSVADPMAIFCGAFLGAVAGHFCARKLKMISTVFLMAAVVPVVPGLGLYRMMACFGQGQTSLGADYGIQAMITIAMTALGLAMGSFVDRSLHRQKAHPVVR